MKWTFDLLSVVQKDTDLQKVGNYYIGPCPFCGGEDRFNLKTTKEIDLWLCRICGDGKYKDAIDYLMKRNGWGFAKTLRYVSNVSDYDMPEREHRVAEHEAQRQKIIDHKLSEFTTQEIWDALHRRMISEEHHREWWRKNGVTNEWQDYLSLGWTPEKNYISSIDGENHVSPAYTIPYFGLGRKFITMQYRMCGDVPPSDRYRFEYGLGTSFYMTTPTLTITNRMIVCEGAKKAIVTREYTPDMSISVVGVPSKSDFGGIDTITKDCESVWIVLDPDAKERNTALAKIIGESKSKIVELPMKVDDAFLFGGLTSAHFNDILRQGVKP